jgi:hypothetical protein
MSRKTKIANGSIRAIKIGLDRFLEDSKIEADGGKKVGKLPGSIPIDSLRALGHPESPIRAIRAKCLDCCCGSASEVRKCVAVTCALWPMPMASNRFHGKKGRSKPAAKVFSAASSPVEAKDASQT